MTRFFAVVGGVHVKLGLAAALACALAAPVARGQTPSDAETLFRQGVDAMRAADYRTACPKLSESYRLEPMPGALFTLAECEAGWGHMATALEHYQAFLSIVTSLPVDARERFGERIRLALDKSTALSLLTPELTIDVAPGAPKTIVITRNGVRIEPESFAVGKRVDPGEYDVDAELDGRRAWTRHLKLEPRDRARVEVPWPLAAPSTPSLAQEGAVAEGGAVAQEGAPRSRTLAYVAGGIGVAGLVTGIVAGAVAWSRVGTIDNQCVQRQCSPEGLNAVSTAKDAGVVSTVGFSVGLAGAATAAVLWLVGGGHPDAATSAGVHPTMSVGSGRGTGFALEGSFQ